MELFFDVLKQAVFYRPRCHNFEELKVAIDRYIYYNNNGCMKQKKRLRQKCSASRNKKEFPKIASQIFGKFRIIFRRCYFCLTIYPCLEIQEEPETSFVPGSKKSNFYNQNYGDTNVTSTGNPPPNTRLRVTS